MNTADGPFAMETTYEWRDTPGGTRMTLRNRGGPTRLSRVFAPLMAWSVRHSTQRDLRRLKQLLEG